MKSIWIPALTLAAGVLGSPLAMVGPEPQTDNRQMGDLSTVLPDLLRGIQSQTGVIGDILDEHPDPIKGDIAKEVTELVGVNFGNLTGALHAAHSVLKSLGEDDELVDGDGKLCDVRCIADMTKGLVGDASGTTHQSLLKLGLHLLGEHVEPFFLALSGVVLTLNTIVGGGLAALAAVVNTIGLSIAAGIAYLGHLSSEKEKQMIGGPDGPVTKTIGKIIGKTVGLNPGV